MTITREISAEDWGKLSNDDQALYEKEGEEGYKFIGVNPRKLLSAKQHEKERANKAKQEQVELQNQLSELKSQLEGLKPAPKEAPADEKSELAQLRGEIDKFRKRLNEQKADHQKTLAQREEQLKQAELQRVLSEASGSAFENPHVGALILEKRVDIAMQDGKPQVRFKDRNGEYDETLDMDGLIKDIASDDRYKGSGVVGTRASGTGGVEKQNFGWDGGYSQQQQTPAPSRQAALAEHLKSVDVGSIDQNPQALHDMLQRFGEGAEEM